MRRAGHVARIVANLHAYMIRFGKLMGKVHSEDADVEGTITLK